MGTLAWRLRAFALLSGGALAVHQLRFALAGPDEAPGLPAHAYVGLLVPAVVVMLTVCAVSLVGAMVRAGGQRATVAALPGLRALWAGATGLLVLMFFVQENVEALAQDGALAGPAAVFGGAGRTAVLLSLAVGLLIALLLRGAAVAVARVARRCLASRPVRPRRRSFRAPRHAPLPARELVARFLVGRGPPVAYR